MEREIPTAAAESDILLARAKRGDLEAVEALFRVHSRRVYTLARRICRSEQDAQDIVQETFVEVARSIGRYRGEGPLGAWIHRVAASKALMQLRRDRLLEPAKGAEGLGEDSLPATGQPHLPQRLDLEAALAQIPAAARAVVWLHDVEGYTHEEIAEMTGLSASFSKSKLARAHARLKELLAPLKARQSQEKDHAPRN